MALLLLILYNFSPKRCLRNGRTRIHMHLMAAVFCTTLTKLVLFFDQLTKGYGNIKIDEMGFNNTVSVVLFIYLFSINLFNKIEIQPSK